MSNHLMAISFFLFILLIIFIIYIQHLRFKLRDHEVLNESILNKIYAYVLLVNDQFEVERTNYRVENFNPKLLKKVGNMLYCKYGVDSGMCGLSRECRKCFIRKALQKSFQDKTDFDHVIADMYIYSGEKLSKDIQSCVFDVSGKYLKLNNKPYILLTLVDKTIEYKQKEELMLARQNAEKASKYKTSFIATMSHEIRTPLNAVIGFSELLAHEEDFDVRAEYAKIIATNGEMITSILSDVLDISKIESGALEFADSEVYLNVLFEQLWAVFIARSRAKDLHLNFIRPEQDYILKTDEKRTKQVLTNFLSNAIKNTNDGSITFSYEVKEKEVYFYVTDSGIGIADKDKSKIFQKFTQLNPKLEGNGLGLSICKSIIEGMGGRIGFDSQMDKGSTFWFYLPIK